MWCKAYVIVLLFTKSETSSSSHYAYACVRLSVVRQIVRQFIYYKSVGPLKVLSGNWQSFFKLDCLNAVVIKFFGIPFFIAVFCSQNFIDGLEHLSGYCQYGLFCAYSFFEMLILCLPISVFDFYRWPCYLYHYNPQMFVAGNSPYRFLLIGCFTLLRSIFKPSSYVSTTAHDFPFHVVEVCAMMFAEISKLIIITMKLFFILIIIIFELQIRTWNLNRLAQS